MYMYTGDDDDTSFVNIKIENPMSTFEQSHQS